MLGNYCVVPVCMQSHTMLYVLLYFVCYSTVISSFLEITENEGYLGLFS